MSTRTAFCPAGVGSGILPDLANLSGGTPGRARIGRPRRSGGGMMLGVIVALLGAALGGGAGEARGQGLRWEQREGYRVATLDVPQSERAGFTLLGPEQTGVRFTNQLSYARGEANQNLLNGAGVAAGDFDGDGLCDLYFASCEGGNGLYRNEGSWRFSNVTPSAGVAAEQQSSKGVAFADVDGDGRLDLIINALGGPNALFRNLGGGRFTNVTASAGLAAKAGGHSLALADVDGDGDLDLYLVNYGEQSILRSGGQFSMRMVNGKPTVSGRWAKRLKLIGTRLIELGEPDVLYLNDGQGRFKPVPWTGGAFLSADGNPLKTEPMDMGLSAQFRDINRDGAPDLYVCNDFQSPDRIWINDGRGRFRELADLAIRSTCHFSMGVDFADIDRDGHDDFFASDMLSPQHALRMTQMTSSNPPPAEMMELRDREQARRNSLNVARGDGTFVDLANFAGVDATDWTWAVAFLDLDLDGFEDLFVVNAHAYDTQDLDMMERMPSSQGAGLNRSIDKSLREFPPLITPNYAFRNLGNRTFAEAGSQWGFASTNISHGIALGDFDNDGDLDMAVSCLWQPPLLYRNDSGAPRVAVRLKGTAPNTQGIGARVRLLGGAVPDQSQEIMAGGRYLSGDEPMRVFAARPQATNLTLEVRWRSGKVSTIHGVRANHLYEIDEAAAGPAPALASANAVPVLFQDVSPALAHAHSEQAFDEGTRQSLLYRSLTRAGPAVAWIDLDGDGQDELVIGGSLGTSVGVYRREGSNWREARPAGWPEQWTWDTAGLAAWADGRGARGLLAAPSTYRPGQEAEAARGLHWLAGSRPGAAPGQGWTQVAPLAPAESSPGPVAVADYDGDGDLDVFVGGRVRPGRYPEAAVSTLWRQDAGQLSLDPANAAVLAGLGMVAGAVWSDLDDDGFPELILACEWGPVRVLGNVRGKLVERTSQLGLADVIGWWQGVNTADVDGDGRLDIIAANWGWNSSYHRPAPATPVVFYYGDLDETGTVKVLETEHAAGRLWPRRNLAALSEFMPALRAQYPNHHAFATVDIPMLLGPKAAKVGKVEANSLASTVFLRRGDRFEPVPLPDEAQYAPAYAVCVADVDGDGREDVFLSQNCFAVRADEPRLDGGLGLWLRGVEAKSGSRSRPGLEPVAPARAGVRVHGQQRGAAVADFDGDGRTDLVVSQNDGATKLFQNVGGRPGLRVRLAGPQGNPEGIGARLRLKFGQGYGAPREVKSGSGYGSQDSLVVVLATPSAPDAIEIRWPGGAVTQGPIPAGAREVRASVDGSVVPVNR